MPGGRGDAAELSRDEAVPGDPEAQTRLARARDTDARSRGDAKRAGRLRRLDGEAPPRPVGAVVCEGDAQRAREIAGPAGPPRLVARDAAPPRHRRQAAQRLHRANEY